MKISKKLLACILCLPLLSTGQAGPIDDDESMKVPGGFVRSVRAASKAWDRWGDKQSFGYMVALPYASMLTGGVGTAVYPFYAEGWKPKGYRPGCFRSKVNLFKKHPEFLVPAMITLAATPFFMGIISADTIYVRQSFRHYKKVLHEEALEAAKYPYAERDEKMHQTMRDNWLPRAYNRRVQQRHNQANISPWLTGLLTCTWGSPLGYEISDGYHWVQSEIHSLGEYAKYFDEREENQDEIN